MRTRAFRSTIVGLLAAAAALAAFPEDANTPTEGWKYGFRSIIDTAQYPNAQDKEGASGMSLEAAWKDIVHWPRLPSSGGDFDWPLIDAEYARMLGRPLSARTVTAIETDPMHDDLPTQRPKFFIPTQVLHLFVRQSLHVGGSRRIVFRPAARLLSVAP